MGTQKFFEQALANFTFETACGGAIRHLADNGYTVKQISEKIDYPASCEQIQTAVFEHFCDSGVLLLKEPEYDAVGEKPEFIREYDSYGKASFRKAVPAPGKIRKKINWKESSMNFGSAELFSRFLEQKILENGVENAYLSCDFGLWPGEKLASLPFLDSRQKDYIQGIPWPPSRIYHRLNGTMTAIVKEMYSNLEYSGVLLFLKTAEKVRIL